jgi:hypothetical protein
MGESRHFSPAGQSEEGTNARSIDRHPGPRPGAETIVLSLHTSRYFALTGVVTRVIESLAEESSFDELAGAIVGEYAITPALATATSKSSSTGFAMTRSSTCCCDNTFRSLPLVGHERPLRPEGYHRPRSRSSSVARRADPSETPKSSAC